jgi:hypothetical protein
VLNVRGRRVLRVLPRRVETKQRTRNNKWSLDCGRMLSDDSGKRDTLHGACGSRTRQLAIHGATESRGCYLRRVALRVSFRAAIHPVFHPRHIAFMLAGMQRRPRKDASAHDRE